jgi:hypothetical protein
MKRNVGRHQDSCNALNKQQNTLRRCYHGSYYTSAYPRFSPTTENYRVYATKQTARYSRPTSHTCSCFPLYAPRCGSCVHLARHADAQPSQGSQDTDRPCDEQCDVHTVWFLASSPMWQCQERNATPFAEYDSSVGFNCIISGAYFAALAPNYRLP